MIFWPLLRSVCIQLACRYIVEGLKSLMLWDSYLSKLPHAGYQSLFVAFSNDFKPLCELMVCPETIQSNSGCKLIFGTLQLQDLNRLVPSRRTNSHPGSWMVLHVMANQGHESFGTGSSMGFVVLNRGAPD